MDRGTATAFRSGGRVYQADSCEPLRLAAARRELRLHALARGSYPGRRLPRGMAPEVRSVGYWDAPEPQTWGLAWHRNEGIELTYVARGRTGFAADRRTFLLTRGDLTVTRPWQEHRVGDPTVGACRLYWLILDVHVRRPNQAWRWPAWSLMRSDTKARLTELLQFNEQPVWSASEEVGIAFDRLGRLVEAPFDSTTDARLKLLINELLVEVLRMLEARRVALDRSLSSSRRSVEVFLDRLPQELDRPWTVDAMAKACGLGRSQFAAYCRELTNASPHALLRRSRLALARKLLNERPDLSVTDVANACGFSSSQYFATAFRADTGMAPTAYRELRA